MKSNKLAVGLVLVAIAAIGVVGWSAQSYRVGTYQIAAVQGDTGWTLFRCDKFTGKVEYMEAQARTWHTLPTESDDDKD